ncbi:MAG: anti-sigma factor [Sulfobacillus thermosulfidooxidans]|nr:MAG: anti-sigma factor [Sulfobacillus thermosulfidooxidans]
MRVDHDRLELNLPLLAAGSLPSDEAAELEVHLQTCVSCQKAYHDYQALLQQLDPHEDDVTEDWDQHDRLRQEFLEKLNAEHITPQTATKRRHTGFLPSAVGWAAVVVIGLGGWASAYHLHHVAAQQEQVIRLMASGQRLDLTSPHGPYRAALYLSKNRAVVLANHLPVPGHGQTYEGWWIQGGHPVAAGTFGSTPSALKVPVPHPEAFAITVEPVGGTKTPTTPILVMATLPG